MDISLSNPWAVFVKNIPKFINYAFKKKTNMEYISAETSSHNIMNSPPAKKQKLARFACMRPEPKQLTNFGSGPATYPDNWLKLRDITEDDFENFGISSNEYLASTCQTHELHMRSRWTSYDVAHGMLPSKTYDDAHGMLPSKQWFHMGLNDHVRTFVMQADRGLAKLFTVLEGHNIKTIDDNGAGYYWNESTLLWEEMCKKKLRKKIGQFFVVLFSEQVKWCELNINFMEKQLSELRSTAGSAKLKYYLKEFDKLKRFKNEYKYTKRILKKISPIQGPYGIFMMISCNAYDKEFKKVVNMSSTELPIKNGNVIDLKTLQVRPRCRDDLWSYESEYIKQSGVIKNK